MDNKELIQIYKTLQEKRRMPCPRCGHDTMLDGCRNALSRHEDIYICPCCGTDEAVLDMKGIVLVLDDWYAVKRIMGDPVIDVTANEDITKKSYYLEARKRFNITGQTIDDIMASALEGGITYWCNRAEIVESTYFGEYASDQISRGGSLRLYDAEEDKQHILTLTNFLKGVSLYVANGPEEIIYNGEVDASEVDALVADAIVQYALFDDVIYG